MSLKLKKMLGPVVLFCLVLAYFVMASGWYEPARLVVRGSLLTERATIEARWDSGAGFNAYERKRFVLHRQPAPEGNVHRVVVRRADSKHPASLSKDVFIHRIAVDGRNLDLAGISGTSGIELHERNLRLSEAKAELELAVEAQESILVELLTNNSSGQASVGVDGVFRERDLYVANEKSTSMEFEHWLVGEAGEFVVKLDMPRYRIRSLQVRNADIKGQFSLSSIELEAGDRTVKVFSGGEKPFANTLLYGLSKVQKRLFSPGQFLYDLVFAALTTWLGLALFKLYRSNGGFPAIFSGQRRLFWLFLAGGLAAYSVWLVAFWPGVASVDSLKIWRAAVLPGIYLNDHPLLNVLLYKYLAHLWNNMAVVPLFHIVMLAVLVASIFYYLHRQRVSLLLLIPFYLIVILSLPVGLYNTVLWKDIPFALLTVLWGYLLVVLYRRRVAGTLKYSKQQIAAFLLLLAAVALIRHNGVVYLLVVPVYFVFLRLIPLRVVVITVLALSAVAGTAALALTMGGWAGGGGYFLSQVGGFLENFLARPVPKLLAETWRDYWQIFNVNQTATAWDLFHLYLGDRTAYSFLQATGWHDVFPYLPPGQSPVPALTSLAMRVYQKSYTVPYVYLTWNAVAFLGLYPLAILLFRWLPSAAIFSSFILVQVLILLVFVDVMNWRYYYFAFLGGYLLVPFMLLDLQRWREQKKGPVHEV